MNRMMTDCPEDDELDDETSVKKTVEPAGHKLPNVDRGIQAAHTDISAIVPSPIEKDDTIDPQ